MRIFRSVFLLVIATIVLLHTLVPHEHHDKAESEICVTAQDESKGFLDWIALGLHINQNEGHLEHFLKDKKIAIFDIVATAHRMHPISFDVQLKEITLTNSTQITRNDHPLTGQCRQSHGLRAPPLA